MKRKLTVVLFVAGGMALLVWILSQQTDKPDQTARVDRVATGSSPTARPELSRITRRADVGDKTLRPPQAGQAPTNAFSPSVRLVADPSAGIGERIAAVARIKAALTPEETAALYTVLLTVESHDQNQGGLVLKNDLMNLLCAQRPPLDDLPGVLARVYRDSAQSEAIRDYAVQHLAEFYETLDGTAGAGGDDGRATIRAVLSEALRETQTSLAGTALLGFARLSRERAEFDRPQIATEALSLAADAQTGERTRLTALQICAELGQAGALPLCRTLAEKSPTVSTQISAIAALGALGTASDVPLLKSFLTRRNDRLQPAVQTALVRLQQRIDSASPAQP